MYKINQLTQLGAFALALGLSVACGNSNSPTVSTPPPANQPGTAPTSTSTPASAVAVSIPAGSMGKGPAAYGVNPLVVAIGTMVTWTNADSLPHTVTADDGSFDSNSLGQGQSFSHTFDKAGTFTYFCKIHGKPSMSGTVQVKSVQ